MTQPVLRTICIYIATFLLFFNILIAGELFRPVPENAQITRFNKFNIAYQLRDAIANGVTKVEFYITDDMGLTWKLYGEDKDLKSPMTIQVPGEGVYGFFCVATDRFGNKERSPGPRAIPESVVVVDTTPPKAKWITPEKDILSKGKPVEFKWESSDDYFSEFPVKIQYTTNARAYNDRNAKWQTLHEKLPAIGTYTWTPPADTTTKYNFRLVCEDRAGYIATVYNQATVTVDNVPPSITSISPLKSNKLSNDITVIADDGNGSGVNAIAMYVSYDLGMKWDLIKEINETGDSVPMQRSSGSSFPVTAPKTGSVGLYPVAFDKAGNASQLPIGGIIGPYILQIDTEPPIVNVGNSFLHGRNSILAYDSRVIDWNSFDLYPRENSAIIYLSSDNGITWRELKRNLPVTGSTVVDFPGDAGGEAKLKITVEDEFGNIGEGFSETFTLSAAQTQIVDVNIIETQVIDPYSQDSATTRPIITDADINIAPPRIDRPTNETIVQETIDTFITPDTENEPSIYIPPITTAPEQTIEEQPEFWYDFNNNTQEVIQKPLFDVGEERTAEVNINNEVVPPAPSLENLTNNLEIDTRIVNESSAGAFPQTMISTLPEGKSVEKLSENKNQQETTTADKDIWFQPDKTSDSSFFTDSESNTSGDSTLTLPEMPTFDNKQNSNFADDSNLSVDFNDSNLFDNKFDNLEIKPDIDIQQPDFEDIFANKNEGQEKSTDSLLPPDIEQTKPLPADPRQLSNHYVKEAEQYIKGNNLDLALQTLASAVETDKNNVSAYKKLAEIYVQQTPADYPKAATAARESVTLDNNDWEAWLVCAEVYYKWSFSDNKEIQIQASTGNRLDNNLINERDLALSNAIKAIENATILVKNQTDEEKEKVALTHGEIVYLQALSLIEPKPPAHGAGAIAMAEYQKQLADYRYNVSQLLQASLPYFQEAFNLGGLPFYREAYHIGIINFRLGGMAKEAGNISQAVKYYENAAKYLEEATTAINTPPGGPKEAYYMLAYCHDQLAEQPGVDRARQQEIALRYWRQTARFYSPETSYRKYADERIAVLQEELGQ